MNTNQLTRHERLFCSQIEQRLAFEVIELVEVLSRLLDKAGRLVLIAGELDFAPIRF